MAGEFYEGNYPLRPERREYLIERLGVCLSPRCSAHDRLLEAIEREIGRERESAKDEVAFR